MLVSTLANLTVAAGGVQHPANTSTPTAFMPSILRLADSPAKTFSIGRTLASQDVLAQPDARRGCIGHRDLVHGASFTLRRRQSSATRKQTHRIEETRRRSGTGTGCSFRKYCSVSRPCWTDASSAASPLLTSSLDLAIVPAALR